MQVDKEEDFSGSSVVKTPHFHRSEPGFPLSEELENEDPTCLEAWLKKKKKKKAEEENHCDACSLRGGTHPSPKCQTQGRWRTLVEQGGSL